MGDQQVLFNQTLPTYVRTHSGGDNDASKASLSCVVKQWSRVSEPDCVQIELTRDEDETFLYTARIDEKVYMYLKKQQHLLVPFGQFPKMLIDLLRTVCEEDRAQTSAKYLCHLCLAPSTSSDQQSSSSQSGPVHYQLEITETNPFKHLVHLAIPVQLATKEQMQKHLLSRMNVLKRRFGGAEQKYRANEQRYKQHNDQLIQKLKAVTSELEGLKTNFDAKLQDWQQEYQVTVRTNEQRLQSECDQLRTENDGFRMRQAELQDENERLDALCKEHVEQLSRLEQANAALDDEVEHWQQKYAQTERELDEIPYLRDRVSRLEEELDERTQQLDGMERRVDEWRDTAASLEAQLATQRSETDKSVQIIRRMMAKHDVEKRRLHEHEEQIAEGVKKLEIMTKECEQLKEELKKLKEEYDVLSKEKQDVMAASSLTEEKLAKAEKDVNAKAACWFYCFLHITSGREGGCEIPPF